MPLSLDPEVAAALMKMMAGQRPPPPPAVGDVKTRRAMVEGLMGALNATLPQVTDVTTKELETTSADGATIRLRWYEKKGGAQGPAILYLHGGGMILGSVDNYDGLVRWLVSTSGVPMLAPEYRLAPEHPHPTPVEDCYAGLTFLAAQAKALGVDAGRIGVMGDSAGGGLSATTALMARDRGGPALARQILIYPMLDDRTTVADPRIAPFASWSYDDNVTGWGALLGASAGKKEVHHHAAAARAEDLSGLPPTYIDVGQLDIFCAESVAYAAKLIQAGVPLELHVHPGAQHAFERLAPQSQVAQRAIADRLRAMKSI